MSQRSAASRLWYGYLHVVCRLGFTALCRIRCRGRQYVPATGGALVLSNHQSNLDPVLVGLACDRRLNYLARDTLFGFAPFRWLIHSLDAIPIDREGLGLSGIKETLRRLKHQEMVLMFPEGTRTRDGEIGPIKPGFVALARRAKVPLVIVAIEGAYEAWPRSKMLPRLTAIDIQFGPPVTPAEFERYDDDGLVAEIERRLRNCHAAARAHRQRRVPRANGVTRCGRSAERAALPDRRSPVPREGAAAAEPLKWNAASHCGLTGASPSHP